MTVTGDQIKISFLQQTIHSTHHCRGVSFAYFGDDHAYGEAALGAQRTGKKIGPILEFAGAAKTRSLVSCGVESATLDRLITKETVAGERSRCSANFF